MTVFCTKSKTVGQQLSAEGCIAHRGTKGHSEELTLEGGVFDRLIVCPSWANSADFVGLSSTPRTSTWKLLFLPS